MVKVVTESEVIKLRTGNLWDPRETREFTVGPSCGKNHGRWLCVTHDEIFGNNWEKDSHVLEQSKKKGPCKLTWFCAHHGPEVP